MNKRGGKTINTVAITSASIASALAGAAFVAKLKITPLDDSEKEDDGKVGSTNNNHEQVVENTSASTSNETAEDVADNVKEEVPEIPANEDNKEEKQRDQDKDENNHDTPTNPEGQDPNQDQEVDPQKIAEEIAHSVEIDESDIDQYAYTIEDICVGYAEDGSEYIVAHAHTPEGFPFLLADLDGDGLFTNVLSIDGEYDPASPLHIGYPYTIDDLYAMSHPEDEYIEDIAMNDITDEDLDIDVIKTDAGNNDVAANPDDDEPVDFAELLAALIGLDNEDNMSSYMEDLESILNDDELVAQEITDDSEDDDIEDDYDYDSSDEGYDEC